MVLHAVPPHPRACAEDDRPADEGPTAQGSSEGDPGGGGGRVYGAREAGGAPQVSYEMFPSAVFICDFIDGFNVKTVTNTNLEFFN